MNMFRHRTFEPIIEVRDGNSSTPFPRELAAGDEVILYLDEFPQNQNAIRVRIGAIGGDSVIGEVSRPTRFFLKDRLNMGDRIEFNERSIFAFA